MKSAHLHHDPLIALITGQIRTFFLIFIAMMNVNMVLMGRI
jgi:hypothetical protein